MITFARCVTAWVCASSALVACSRAELYAVTGGASGDRRSDAAAPSAAIPELDASSMGGNSSAMGGSNGEGGAGVAGRFAGGAGGRAAGGSAGVDGAGGVGGEPSLPSCPSAVLQAGDQTRSLAVGALTRSYVLHVPPTYDGTTPAPLVVDFHGIGRSAQYELENSPYPAVLDAEGVIMAFPDGIAGPAGTAWNVGPCCVAEVDDLAFARALVEDVRADACVDTRRVYAVGVLTGGGMAHYLGCHAADVFAAIAPAAFDLLQENVDACVPARPLTVISFRGTEDMRVPYEGGPSSLVPGMPLTFLGAQATFERWAEINGCTGSASSIDANGCVSYSECAGGVEVTLCTQPTGTGLPGDPAIAWPALKRQLL